jgi:competence protein ComEC
MSHHGAPFIKKIPSLRPLLSLIAGILIQWYLKPLPGLLYSLLGITAAFLCLLLFFPSYWRFRSGMPIGISICLIISISGALLVWHKDPRNDPKGLHLNNSQGRLLVASIQAPPVERPKTIKISAKVVLSYSAQGQEQLKGNILIYILKTDTLPPLRYGQYIVFHQPLQPISNSGNPGCFDYEQYALFQGITRQVFLEPGKFFVTDHATSPIKRFLFNTQDWIISVLKKNINGTRETGLAEALLIGYKNDLDKTLLQSYSNTGVVHIIAISGLHLGLIYGILLLLLKPLESVKRMKWLRLTIILCGLWIFTTLAGAQPSVLRSAIMFTCLAMGECLSRRSSIYNSLSFSALLLLCINPFWLWDIGFQLSYAAVLSLVVFMRPVYHSIHCSNRILDLAWKMNAVTLSAQILTTPLSIYYFHQFPNYFLLTNFIAVPLSSIILVMEILLCGFCWQSIVVAYTGRIITWLLQLMNDFIIFVEDLPFSIWQGIQVNIPQVILLLAFIVCISMCLHKRQAIFLVLGLVMMTIFLGIRTVSLVLADRQRILVVYNIPGKNAIDLIEGRHNKYLGHASLSGKSLEKRYHLDPARIRYRVIASKELRGFAANPNQIYFHGNRILILNKNSVIHESRERARIDLLIISGSPRINLFQLKSQFLIRQVVADASNSQRKIQLWERDCAALGIPFHPVAIKGAFVMTWQ